jgi:hypothetical protein
MSVGIVGVGRLGRALAERLAGAHELLLYDREPARAAEAALHVEGEAARDCGAPFARCEAVLLALPPGQIADAARCGARHARPGLLLVNLATSVPTDALRAAVGRPDVCVVGAKPVTQATALLRGLPAVFVSACREARVQAQLAALLSDLGTLVWGDEELVGAVNATATRHALRLSLGLREELAALGCHPALIEAALHAVVVGTLLDDPDDRHNPYIVARLREAGLSPEAAGVEPALLAGRSG